jgi:hypothetical protein
MIQNEQQLEQSLQGMQLMYNALPDLRAKHWPQHPQWYAVMAEGPLEQIRRLRAEVDAWFDVGRESLRDVADAVEDSSSPDRVAPP